MAWLKRWWMRPMVAVCILAVIISVGWLLFNKGPFGGTKVTVVKVVKEDLQPAVFGIGTVQARLSYAVGPTQAGRVLSVSADQGDKVKKGDVLGGIDPIDLDQRLQSASSAVVRAEHAVAVAAAQVRNAINANAFAQAEAKRYTALFTDNAISRELAESKQTDADAARAALDAALSSLAVAREAVKGAAFDRDAIISQRSNLQIISPMDGIVVSRDVEPGTTVVAGQSVFHLVDQKTIWVRTRIDQARFYSINVGQSATIVLRSRPDEPLSGRVERLEVQGDDVTEERFVDVAFSELPNFIPLGELAEVTITRPPVPDALVVPTAAIKRSNKQFGVWISESGKVHFQPVKMGGQTLDGKIEILDGLKDGDFVVVITTKQLEDGMRVRVEEKP